MPPTPNSHPTDADWATAASRVPPSSTSSGSAGEELLLLACLRYGGGDGPDRWAHARQLLAARPEAARESIHTAAAAADAAHVAGLLATDASLANAQGGPHAWEPLLYLAYSRLDPDVPATRSSPPRRRCSMPAPTPNAGFLHTGLPSPFTALTGVFGEGEQGPEACPRHPQWEVLGRLLLERGADPNDSQTLYNRQFLPDDSHLELLYEFGLGTGDGGPWRARLGAALSSPADLLRGQLRWAAERDLSDRVRLLASHGLDVTTPFTDGRTPIEVAALNGNRRVVEQLHAVGVGQPGLAPADALTAAGMAGDRAFASMIADDDPGSVEAAIARRPDLVVTAAALGRPQAVSLLTEIGFDVNAGARPGSGIQVAATALHVAAGEGNEALVRLLLDLGADPHARDAAFDGTPLDWAVHQGQPGAAELLEPLTNGPG